MLTMQESEWLWQVYWITGGVFILSVFFLSASLKVWGVRLFLVTAFSVLVFSSVEVNEAGNKAPALLVWGFDLFLKSDSPNTSAPIYLARNAFIAFLLFFGLTVSRYMIGKKKP